MFQPTDSLRTAALWGAFFFLCAAKLPADQDLTALSLDQLMKIEVQTTSLHSQDIAIAPGLVTVITAEQIEVNGYRTLGEALNHVMGIYVTYDHTYYSAGVAGFSIPGDWATRILVLVNGHSLTDNIFGSANYFGDDFALDMSLVRRIEIVRGPSSALYGSNGILATINVITKNPDKEHGTTVHMETDTFGEKKVTVTTGRHLFQDSSLLISGTVFNTSGQPDIYIPALNSPATNNGNAVNMDGSRGYRLFANFKSGNWELLSLTGLREKIQPVSWAPTVFNDRGTRVRIPRDGDQRSEVMAITIPK
jgi:iron complex outermembrane receptor protein